MCCDVKTGYISLKYLRTIFISFNVISARIPFFNAPIRCQCDSVLKYYSIFVYARSLKEWLNSVNDMHDNFKSRLPEFVAPEFSCVDDVDDENEEAIILHYFSYRGKLLAPVVVGMVMEVAKNSFNMILDMEKIATQDEDGSRFTSWRITLVSLFNPALDAKASILRQTSKKENSNSYFKSGVVSTNTNLFHGRPNSSNTIEYVERRVHLLSANFLNFRPSVEEKETGAAKESARCPFSARSNLNLPFNTCSFTPQQLQELFPYHIAVDRNFMVLQEGSKLPTYLRGITTLGTHIGNIFDLKFPKCEWDWSDIKLNLDISFELRLANTAFVTDMLTAYAKGRLFEGDRSRATTADERKYTTSSSNPTAKPSFDMR